MLATNFPKFHAVLFDQPDIMEYVTAISADPYRCHIGVSRRRGNCWQECGLLPGMAPLRSYRQPATGIVRHFQDEQLLWMEDFRIYGTGEPRTRHEWECRCALSTRQVAPETEPPQGGGRPNRRSCDICWFEFGSSFRLPHKCNSQEYG
jgi:hypothetical protein